MSSKEIRKCLCNSPECSKCLGIHCQDDNCPTHSLLNKIKMKERISVSSNSADDDIFRKEIERLKNLFHERFLEQIKVKK